MRHSLVSILVGGDSANPPNPSKDRSPAMSFRAARDSLHPRVPTGTVDRGIVWVIAGTKVAGIAPSDSPNRFVRRQPPQELVRP
jgi:hypothetical protein